MQATGAGSFLVSFRIGQQLLRAAAASFKTTKLQQLPVLRVARAAGVLAALEGAVPSVAVAAAFTVALGKFDRK